MGETDLKPMRDKAYWTMEKHNYSYGNCSFFGTYPTCSKCGFFNTGVKQNTKFCGGCGAEMEFQVVNGNEA